MASGNATTTTAERGPVRPTRPTPGTPGTPGNGAARSGGVIDAGPNGGGADGGAPDGAAANGAGNGRVGHGEEAAAALADRSAAIAGRSPSPFTPRQLARLEEALTMSSRETGLLFSVYVGGFDAPTREHAERLHQRLGPNAASAVLVAVSPGQRVVHVVTGETSRRRLPDRCCALAVLSMEASFSGGDLVGGVVNGLRMLSDQAGRRPRVG